jgi:hypothetical protein
MLVIKYILWFDIPRKNNQLIKTNFIMNKFKNIVVWISIILMVMIAISTIVVRFIFPELTETQLFLKMWWISIPLVLCVGGFHWGFNSN